MGYLSLESALPQTEAIDTLTATSIRFRQQQLDNGAVEEHRMPLVAHHDQSIHFTNSTTSVMKPYLRGELPIPNAGVFLSQPAMGSQGIQKWLQEGTLSPYASYFTSYGVLYPYHVMPAAASNLCALARDAWDLDQKDLRLQYHAADTELTEVLSVVPQSLQVASENGSVLPFRHRYGLQGVHGKNINLQARVRQSMYRDIGNLTLLYDGEQPLAWEVSFDSSPVVAAMTDRTYVVAASPTAARISRSCTGSMNEKELVAADCLNVCTALALEGMQPRSKGASGIMRKFFKEFITTMQQLDYTLPEALRAAEENIAIESDARSYLSPEAAPSIHPGTAQQIFDVWLAQLWEG